MEAFVIYNLKVGVCLAVFYLFYKLLLSRDTFHRLNRVLLLMAVAVSFVLPLCVITLDREHPMEGDTLPVSEGIVSNVWEEPLAETAATAQPMASLPEAATANAEEETVSMAEYTPASASQTAAKPFPWAVCGMVLFGVGVALSLIATLCSLIATAHIIRRGRREPLGDGVIVSFQTQPLTPFSWVKWIVLSEENYTQSGAQILTHERAHIRCGHSWDLLFTDLMSCLQWFNPAMWLLRAELRALHEYEADAAVLEAGANPKEYQMLLIKKAVGGRWYSVANSLNHSNLKNRITMMLRKRSSRWAAVKTAFVLPLVCVALGAFAQTSYVPSEGKDRKNPTDPQAFSGGMSIIREGEGMLRILFRGEGDAVTGAMALLEQIAMERPDEATKLREFIGMLQPLAADPTVAAAGGAAPSCLSAGGLVYTPVSSVPDASEIGYLWLCDAATAESMVKEQHERLAHLPEEVLKEYPEEFPNGTIPELPDVSHGALIIALQSKLGSWGMGQFAEELARGDKNMMWFHGSSLRWLPGGGLNMSGTIGTGTVPEEHLVAMVQTAGVLIDPLPYDRMFGGKVAARMEDEGHMIVTMYGTGDAMMAAASLARTGDIMGQQQQAQRWANWDKTRIDEIRRILSRMSRSAPFDPALRDLPKPLCLVDGQPADEAPDALEIARIEVLDRTLGEKTYGKRGADGVILVSSKDPDTSTLAQVDAEIAKGDANAFSAMGVEEKITKQTRTGFYSGITGGLATPESNPSQRAISIVGASSVYDAASGWNYITSGRERLLIRPKGYAAVITELDGDLAQSDWVDYSQVARMKFIADTAAIRARIGHAADLLICMETMPYIKAQTEALRTPYRRLSSGLHYKNGRALQSQEGVFSPLTDSPEFRIKVTGYKKPLFLVNGVPTSRKEFNAMNHSEFTQWQEITDPAVIARLGEPAAGCDALIVLRKGYRGLGTSGNYRLGAMGWMELAQTDNFRIYHQGMKPLVAVDGVITPVSFLDKIDTKKYGRMKFVHDFAQLSAYGEAAKECDVLIVVERRKAEPAAEKQTSVFVNGKPMPHTRYEKIRPELIQSVDEIETKNGTLLLVTMNPEVADSYFKVGSVSKDGRFTMVLFDNGMPGYIPTPLMKEAEAKAEEAIYFNPNSDTIVMPMSSKTKERLTKKTEAQESAAATRKK